MDTVHDIVEDLTPVEVCGNITGFNAVMMEQTGIGGDDKVGIYIALQCLSSFDNIKVAFFRDEEIGCVGSYDAEMSFFSDCRFVLQCDRRGNDDFIVNASGVDLSSNQFQDDVLPIISNYGYKFAYGMMTDVMALKENGIKCSVANMSCGYYNPHMPNEYVNIDDVENCLDMCKTIIEWCTDTYKHKYKPKKYAPAPYSKYPTRSVKTLWDDDFQVYTDKSDKKLSDEWGWHERTTTTLEDEPSICMDCAGGPIVDFVHGLCKSCHTWYKKANYIA